MSDGKATTRAHQKRGKVGEEQNDAISKSQKKAREDINGVQRTATDEEIDEFFAILRRMHAAVRHLKRSDRNCNLLAEERQVLRDVMDGEKLTENDRDSDVVTAEGRKKKDVDQNMGFDLNAYPEFDSA